METEKKYRLTDEFITIGNRKLYRIEALKDFAYIKKGEKGGFVESEDNLSQNGNCWVYRNARVYANARVFGDAQVYGSAKVCGAAMITDKAKVYGSALIYGNAAIYGDAVICINARVYGEAEIKGNATISNCSDYIVFKNWWSSGRYFTWTRSNNMWKVGCFYGTGEELIAKAYKDSELSGREYKKAVKYVKSILKDSNTTTILNKIKQCLTKFLKKFKLY